MAKQFAKARRKKSKLNKKRDEHNRLRNIIVNFRVSPHEKAVIDARIEVTGMSKQDYYRQSCMYQKILVKGNIRSFDAIRTEVREIKNNLQVNPDISSLSTEHIESLKTILEILNYLYGGDDSGKLS